MKNFREFLVERESVSDDLLTELMKFVKSLGFHNDYVMRFLDKESFDLEFESQYNTVPKLGTTRNSDIHWDESPNGTMFKLTFKNDNPVTVSYFNFFIDLNKLECKFKPSGWNHNFESVLDKVTAKFNELCKKHFPLQSLGKKYSI